MKNGFWWKCSVALIALPVLASANSTSLGIRKTGAPGDVLCTQCHNSSVNSGRGNLQVIFPTVLNYAPGEAQTWEVRVSDPGGGVRTFGFQLTARLASSEANGQAGNFKPVDQSTAVRCDNGQPASAAGCGSAVQFISHVTATASNSWQFTWTPPATAAGNIRVYIAAVAGNGNGSASGDAIYAADYTLTPRAASPALSQTGAVLNGASFLPGIAPHAWISIFGQNLASNARTWRADEISGGNLPTSLDGIGVRINGKAAAVSYISPQQLNVQVPDDNSAGTVAVEVTTPQATLSTTAVLQPVAPAFFMFDPGNRLYIAAQHADYSAVGKAGLYPGLASTPARPGEVILLYGTGFGATTPAVAAGQVVLQAAALANPVRVWFGGVPAEVRFAGLTGAGLNQLNVVVPEVPDGDVAVVAEIGGIRTQEGAHVTVARVVP